MPKRKKSKQSTNDNASSSLPIKTTKSHGASLAAATTANANSKAVVNSSQQQKVTTQQLSNEVARLRNIFLQNGVSLQEEQGNDSLEEDDAKSLLDKTKRKKDVVFPKSEYEYDRSLEPVQQYRGFISRIHNLIVQEHSSLNPTTTTTVTDQQQEQQQGQDHQEQLHSTNEEDKEDEKLENSNGKEEPLPSGFDSGFIALPPPLPNNNTPQQQPEEQDSDDDEEESYEDEEDNNDRSQKKKKQKRMNEKEEETMTATRFKGNWSLGQTQTVRSGMVFLHNEMIAYLAHVSPSQSDQEAREEIVNQINQVAKEFWPESTARLFGSCATGLCLPDSDVDISLFNVPHEAIHKLSNVFRSRNMVEMLQKLDNANVPIVKLRFRGSPFTADISFNQVGGIDTAMFIRKMMEYMPEIKPLVLVIKHFLAQRDLNETYRGGMGSYLCFLTVVAVCQRARRLHPNRPSNLGELLLDYLDFYGNVLNYEDVGICLLDGGQFFRKQDRRWLGSEKDRGGVSLWLEDPMNPDSNIGSKAYKMQLVRHAFSVAHGALMMKIREFESQQAASSSSSSSNNFFDSSKSILATIIRLKNMNNGSASSANANSLNVRKNQIVQFDTESEDEE